MKPIVAALAILVATLALHARAASGDPICSVSWVGGTDNRWETGANWSTGEEPSGIDDVCITAAGADVVLERAAAVNSLTVGAALRVSARNSSTPIAAAAGITVLSGGLIDVTSTGAYASSLNGGTVANHGTVRLLAGAGGKRTIAAPVVNTGRLEVTATSTIDGNGNGSATVANSGTLAVAGPGALTIGATDRLVLQDGGTIEAGSTVSPLGTLRLEGGAITGSGAIAKAAGTLELATDPGEALPGKVLLQGGTVATKGSVPTALTLQVQGTAGFEPLAGELQTTNRGTIVLDAAASEISGLPMVNEGTIRLTGAGGERRLSSTLDNRGTVTVEGTTAAYEGAGPLTNGGTLTVGADGALDLVGSRTLKQQGILWLDGSLNADDDTIEISDPRVGGAAPIALVGASTLRFDLAPGTPLDAGFVLSGGANHVEGDVPAQTTLRVQGTAVLASPTATNRGRIVLDAASEIAGGLLVNEGTLTGDGTVDGDLHNAALLAPGALNVTGGFTQSASGTLRMGADGASRLVAAGASSLGGTLSVVRGGFTPAAGDTAELVSGPLSGAFAAVDGLGTGHPRHLLDVTSTAVRIRWADLPGAPGGVTATAAGRSATVRWTAAAPNGDPVDGYTITAHPVGGGTDVVATAGPAERTKTLTGLVNGTAYDLTVTAANGIGEGAGSTAARVTPAGVGPTSSTGEPPAPSAPADQTPAAADQTPAPADEQAAPPPPSEPARVGTPIDARTAARAALADLVTALAAAGPGRLAKGVRATLTPAQPGLYEIAVSMRTPRKKGRRSRLVLLASGKSSSGQIRLRPTARGRGVLRRARTLKVVVRTTFTPAGGRAVSAQRTLTLKAKRRKTHARAKRG